MTTNGYQDIFRVIKWSKVRSWGWLDNSVSRPKTTELFIQINLIVCKVYLSKAVWKQKVERKSQREV